MLILKNQTSDPGISVSHANPDLDLITEANALLLTKITL